MKVGLYFSKVSFSPKIYILINRRRNITSLNW